LKNPGEFIDWFKDQPKGENTLNYYYKEVVEYLRWKTQVLEEFAIEASKVAYSDSSEKSLLEWVVFRAKKVLGEVNEG